MIRDSVVTPGTIEAGRPAARDQAAVEWLLASREPAIRLLARRDVLDGRPSGDERAAVSGELVAGLLSGQQPDGGFGGHPYQKWAGAHWRLVSLVELGIPAGEPRAVAALDTVLDWLTSAAHRRNVPVINGLARRCASQEGNALAVASRLRRDADPRVQLMARSLIDWQWPDGGWNCDRRMEAHRSSFHETLPPMWGLHEFAAVTGDADAAAAARRAAELFLKHRIFRSLKTGQPINQTCLQLRYPPYWHFDVLQALVVLGRMGLASDRRADDAVAHLESRRRPDGRWRAGPRWWSTPGGKRNAEAVDWGSVADQMVTLNALRVLAARRELELT